MIEVWVLDSIDGMDSKGCICKYERKVDGLLLEMQKIIRNRR